MAKHWARILMGLIFVFATISAPVRIQAAPAAAHSIAMPMDGMSEACAKAMTIQAAKAKPHEPGAADRSGGCCANGCNCPLSHCPATPPPPAAGALAPLYDGVAVPAAPAGRTLVSFHTETLIRPPRT
jgi:hypothetical protein